MLDVFIGGDLVRVPYTQSDIALNTQNGLTWCSKFPRTFTARAVAEDSRI